MYCKQCGNKISEGSKFCASCGAVQTTEQSQTSNQQNHVVEQPTNMEPNMNQNYNQTQNHPANEFKTYQENQNQSSNSYNNSEEETLLREFVGPAYEAIKRESFSLPAFFLLPFYFLYRKMYLYGSLLFLLIVVSIFIPIFNTIVPLGSCIFFGLKFKDIYFKFAKEKVKNINQNNFMSFDQKIEFCRKKGGTNVLLAIFMPFSIPIVFIILTPIIMSLLVKPYTIGDYDVSLPRIIEIVEQEKNRIKFTREQDDVNLTYSIEYMEGNIESAKTEFSYGSNSDKIKLRSNKTIDGKEYATYEVDLYGQKTGVVIIELDDDHCYMGIVTDKTSNTDITDDYINLFYKLNVRNTSTK